MDYRIYPPEGILETTVELPAAKSIALRETVLAWLAGDIASAGDLKETNRDAATIYVALTALSAGKSHIDVHDCGAALRFVTALAAATPDATVTIGGTDRLNKRPIGPLVEALRKLGADISYTGAEGYPPLAISGKQLAGGTVDIDATGSSQYTSALMLATPLMSNPLEIRLVGVVQSAPYISMTAALLRRRGVEAEVEPTRVTVTNTPVKSAATYSEPDWSAATFWYEIAALSAGWVTLTGLKKDSVQGDRAVATLFERLGVLTDYTDEGAELSATPEIFSHLDADVTDMPDAAPALAVTAAMAGLPFRLSGVGVLRCKECDRLEAIGAELAKVGILTETENYDNILVWDGRRHPIVALPEFDTYGDHRMAMALAPIAIFIPGIVVKDVEVVSKSYPGYWEALEDAGFRLVDPSLPLEMPEAE